MHWYVRKLVFGSWPCHRLACTVRQVACSVLQFYAFPVLLLTWSCGKLFDKQCPTAIKGAAILIKMPVYRILISSCTIKTLPCKAEMLLGALTMIWDGIFVLLCLTLNSYLFPVCLGYLSQIGCLNKGYNRTSMEHLSPEVSFVSFWR